MRTACLRPPVPYQLQPSTVHHPTSNLQRWIDSSWTDRGTESLGPVSVNMTMSDSLIDLARTRDCSWTIQTSRRTRKNLSRRSSVPSKRTWKTRTTKKDCTTSSLRTRQTPATTSRLPVTSWRRYAVAAVVSTFHRVTWDRCVDTQQGSRLGPWWATVAEVHSPGLGRCGRR